MLAKISTKCGYYQFRQHIISDHKGAYLHFRVHDLFDSFFFDKSQASYRKLQMVQRDIVRKYITRLDILYREHNILDRATNITGQLGMTKTYE